MKWMRLWSAVAATVSLTAAAQAGGGCLLGNNCGSSKCCGCASDCQPVCCKPTIQMPCQTNVYTYQRQKSCLAAPCCKPACCTTCAAPKCCAPKCCAPKCCTPCSTCTAPACTTCQAAPTCNACQAAPTCSTCQAAPTCSTGCGETCGQSCGSSCNKGCGLKGFSLFGHKNKCCTPGDPCEIAKLIYESQTACYAKCRAKAVHQLGHCYSCQCNPEIMGAFIYALNDSDERVRKAAADEIGDQLDDNPCCCSPEVIAALTCALGDCDRCVVRNAKSALQQCGYDVVAGCCQKPCNTCNSCNSGCNKGCGMKSFNLFGGCKKKSCCQQTCTTCCTTTCNTCNTGCATGGCANGTCAPGAAGAPLPMEGAPAPEASPAPGASPAPAPPADPQTYYVPVRPTPKKSSLAGLLGLAN